MPATVRMDPQFQQSGSSQFHCHALPPTVKRKYFSTLERLRLAHDCPRCNPDLSYSDQRPLTASARPSSSRGSSYISRTSKAFRSASNAAQTFLTHTDAQWFSRLPEKVQRTQFSKEERQLLAGERDSVFVDSTDKNFYRLRQQAAHSVPTPSPSTPSSISSRSRTSSASSFEYFDTLETMDSSTADMDESVFRWMDEESELDLRLDDYHNHVKSHANAAQKSQFQPRLPSFRRNLSLSALPFASNTAQSPVIDATPPIRPSASRRISVTSIQQAFHRRTTSRAHSSPSLLPIQYPNQSSIPSIDPQASHYTDPVARHKLRNYLASPSKFDEAIEFGFPSLQNQTTHSGKDSHIPSAPRPSLCSVRRNKTAPSAAVCPQTFLNSSSLSLLSTPSSHNGSTTSLPESSGPHTPSEIAFREHARRLPLMKTTTTTGEVTVIETTPSPTTTKPTDGGAPGKTTASSSTSRKASEPFAHILAAGNREMTLRMTLTRPDLRSSEKEVMYYGIGHGEDPLALEKLPPMSKSGGGNSDIWETMGRGEGKPKGVMRKVWGKISKRI